MDFLFHDRLFSCPSERDCHANTEQKHGALPHLVDAGIITQTLRHMATENHYRFIDNTDNHSLLV